MNLQLTISDEELQSDKWKIAREMCEHYGYDIREIAAGIARFRMTRMEARAKALTSYTASHQQTLASAPATLVHYNQVRQFWNAGHQRWTQPGIVYIGRAMLYQGLPTSPFANPFRIEKDTDEARGDAIELYAEWIMQPAQAHLLHQLDDLRGKTLVCWCHPRRCHGDVLLKLLADRPSYADVQESTNEGSPEWQPELKPTVF
jgi:hypothetical protein